MQEGCTVNLTVKYIARKWTLLILLELYKGEGHTRRFSELKGCLFGITQKVLSARLRELEKEGLLFTRFYCTGNRSHEGTATLFGGHPALPYTTWPENPEKYRKMPSMVRILNDTGYSSSFYFPFELVLIGLDS